MTPEQIESTMNFILQQQSAFAAHQAEIDSRIRKVNDNLLVQGELLDRQEKSFDGRLNRVLDTFDRFAQESDQRFRHLDERLNVLMTGVEKHISGSGHSGGARS